MLEKTLESPLDCKEIQQVHLKGDQSWVFIGRTDAEAKNLIYADDIPVHFSSLIPRMSMFTLAISCLTTSNVPWFMDLTFQVSMQHCSLQHRTLLLSPVTSTTGHCFHSCSIPSFFLELFLHWSPVAYWVPTDLGSSSFSILSFCLFILFMGFSRQEYWSGLPFPSPVDHILSDLSTMTRPSWVAPHGMAWFFELDKAVVPVIRLASFLWLWPPHAKSWLIGKDPDAERDWGQEEKGMAEDEMAGWHHWLDAHAFG